MKRGSETVSDRTRPRLTWAEAFEANADGTDVPSYTTNLYLDRGLPYLVVREVTLGCRSQEQR